VDEGHHEERDVDIIRPLQSIDDGSGPETIPWYVGCECRTAKL